MCSNSELVERRISFWVVKLDKKTSTDVLVMMKAQLWAKSPSRMLPFTEVAQKMDLKEKHTTQNVLGSQAMSSKYIRERNKIPKVLISQELPPESQIKR